MPIRAIRANPSNPCQSVPSDANPSNPCQAVSIRAIRAKLCQSEQSVPFHAKPCQSEQSVPFHAKRCQSEQSEQSVPSCVNPTDITARGLCRVLPAQCLARRSSPAALRRRLSSATPSQLCDAVSALRHHLSSATPPQLCDATSALRHHQLSRQENDAICAESTCGNDARGSV